MRYRTLGKTGLRVSVLGFGCMRLPEADKRVDRERAIPLLRRAVELGVNFFDSATMYCYADSENAVGEAFEGMRDKVVLSTKNPLREVTAAEWRKQLETSLRKLRTDYIDIYNHHGMSWGCFEKHFDPAKGGHTREMLKAKDEGLIRHVAFSFHDSPDALKRLADTGYYENVILQYNLLDQTNADAIQYAHEKGMGVVVMGPVGGGRLALASGQIKELTGADSTVEAALRFVWAHPGVDVALSGMQDLAMLEQNVRLAETATPFQPAQIEQLNRLVRERKERNATYCSGCKYCLPVCKSDIPIPEILKLWNEFLVFGLENRAAYLRLAATAANCTTCSACVAACPQKIDIPVRLREPAAKWDERFGSVALSTTVERVAPDGAFALKLRAHNFASAATPLNLTLTPLDGTTLKKRSAKAAALKPFARKTFTLEGRADPASGRIAFRAQAQAHGRESGFETDYRYLLLPQGCQDDWESGVWHSFQATAGDFSADRETAPLHRARIRLGRDPEALVIHAEVDDDFLFPTREDRDKGVLSVDALELYLDGREANRCGFKKYEKGVSQILVYPGTPGQHPAFFHTKDAMQMEVRSFPAPRGYRLAIRIPFKEFCVGTLPPTKIGLDLAVNTADRAGHRVGHYFFAGNDNNWKDPSNFREVWLT